MIEVTVPLTLPIRRVFAAKGETSPPERLRDEFARLAAGGQPSKARHRTSGSPQQIEQELEQLRQQRAALAKSIRELQQIVRSTDERLKGLLNEVRETTIELAHAIAVKLVFEQVAADQFPIANLVQEVLARLHSRDAAVVRLHPDDLALLQEFPVTRSSGDERELQFIADATLARGDCKATAGEIKVVYELRHQIEEIRRQLLSTVNGHAETGP